MYMEKRHEKGPNFLHDHTIIYINLYRQKMYVCGKRDLYIWKRDIKRALIFYMIIKSYSSISRSVSTRDLCMWEKRPIYMEKRHQKSPISLRDHIIVYSYTSISRSVSTRDVCLWKRDLYIWKRDIKIAVFLYTII